MKQEMQTALEAVKEVMIEDYMRFMPENERMQTEFIAVSYTHLTLPTKRIV